MRRNISMFFLLFLSLEFFTQCNDKNAASKKTKAASRPSDIGETLPGFLSQKKVNGTSANDETIDLDNASITIPAQTISQDYSVILSQFDQSSIESLIPDGLTPIGKVFRSSFYSDDVGTLLSPEAILAAYQMKLPIPQDADVENLAMIVLYETDGILDAQVILARDLLIESVVDGSKTAAFMASVPQLRCTLALIDDAEQVRQIASNKPIDGVNKSVSGGEAVDIKSENGDIYFAKNSFDSAFVRLKRIKDPTTVKSVVVSLSPVQALSVSSYGSSNAATKISSQNPGQLTMHADAESIDQSKAEIVYALCVRPDGTV